MRVLIEEGNNMLTQRKGNILRIIVGEHISTGLPVSSKAIFGKGLGVSPATIRNEMIELEEEGYISQPHTSAGRIPSDQGYRYYIRSLMGDVYLSPEEQRLRVLWISLRISPKLDVWELDMAKCALHRSLEFPLESASGIGVLLAEPIAEPTHWRLILRICAYYSPARRING